MKIAIISFTKAGGALAAKLKAKLNHANLSCKAYGLKPYSEGLDLIPYVSVKEWAKDQFYESNGLIFIGACGIAVRTIAPLIQDKYHDPAVVVVDETGHWVIPILSGHVGGANDLALQLAECIGAVAVLTTATDCQGVFAVDQWAKTQGMVISNRNLPKKISAALLAGRTIGFQSDFPISLPLPLGIVTEDASLGIAVTLDPEKLPFRETLQLIPQILSLGIGCRKGTSMEEIAQAVDWVLQKNHLSSWGINQVCTIDLKAEEEGLLAFCKSRQLPLKTFASEELKNLSGDFTASNFVAKVTGVNNVCERAAVLGSQGKILVRKQVYGPVTVAVASEDFSCSFNLRNKGVYK